MTTFTIQHEREEDGRWIAEVPELPGVLAYGASLMRQWPRPRYWPCVY